MTAFLAFTILGLVTGAGYAVAASGLVLTYSTSRVFNMAHGAVAAASSQSPSSSDGKSDPLPMRRFSRSFVHHSQRASHEL